MLAGVIGGGGAGRKGEHFGVAVMGGQGDGADDRGFLAAVANLEQLY